MFINPSKPKTVQEVIFDRMQTKLKKYKNK